MKRCIEIVEYGENGGEMGVVHRVDITGKTESQANRVMDGVEAILFNCGERYYMLNSGRSVALIPAYVAEAMVKSTQPS